MWLEPFLPVLVHLQARLVLHGFSFNLSLEGGRLNCSFWFHPKQGDGSSLPPCAGDGGRVGGNVTDGSSLQGWGCGRGADKKQLGLPHHLLTQPETFGSVLGNYKRKGTYTALPRKATTRMIWFILRAVWYFQHWLNQEWASFYIHNKPKEVEKSAVISTATNASADWTITFTVSSLGGRVRKTLVSDDTYWRLYRGCSGKWGKIYPEEKYWTSVYNRCASPIYTLWL